VRAGASWVPTHVTFLMKHVVQARTCPYLLAPTTLLHSHFIAHLALFANDHHHLFKGISNGLLVFGLGLGHGLA